jgi:hypothetical protein
MSTTAKVDLSAVQHSEVNVTREDISWHLDKKVPIGLILALLAQTIVITSWGTSKFENIDNRISNLEKSDGSQANHENRLVVLEQKFNYIQISLDEIKDILKREPTP